MLTKKQKKWEMTGVASTENEIKNLLSIKNTTGQIQPVVLIL
jgi:hypothetical protein